MPRPRHRRSRLLAGPGFADNVLVRASPLRTFRERPDNHHGWAELLDSFAVSFIGP
jgi:hypothetical protein